MAEIGLKLSEAITVAARLSSALEVVRTISRLPAPLLWAIERCVGRPLFGWRTLADDSQYSLRLLTKKIDDWMDSDASN